MAESSRTSRQPPGVMPTIIGGLAGAAVVYVVGPPIANAVATDGLGGLGTALLLLFILWCVGTGLGVGIALVARGHPRPVVTALLAIPGTVIAVMFTFFVGRSVESSLVLWPLLLGATVLVLWLARVIAMASSTPPLKEG